VQIGIFNCLVKLRNLMKGRLGLSAISGADFFFIFYRFIAACLLSRKN
jgi:hypothetical protein